MAQDMDHVRTGVARPVVPAGPEWYPEPQIVTPVRSTQDWEWATQIRPPALSGTLQEKWAKAVSPFRAMAFGFLWLTWHWARTAALTVVLTLIIILIIVR
jgi:hypothetical protein